MARRTKRSVVQSLYSSQICSSVQNSNLKHNNTHPHVDGCKSVPEADEDSEHSFVGNSERKGRSDCITVTQPATVTVTLTGWQAARYRKNAATSLVNLTEVIRSYRVNASLMTLCSMCSIMR